MRSVLVTAFLVLNLPAVFGAAAVSKPSTGVAKLPATDAAIEQNIRARFAKSKISADHFQVHVLNGVATLEGKTDIIQHKGTATRIGRTSGATRVENKIQISDAARQRASANLAKGRQSAALKRSEIVKR